MNRFDMSKQEEEKFIERQKNDSQGFLCLVADDFAPTSSQIEMAYRHAFSCGFHAGYEFGSEKAEENTINNVRAALHLSNWVREKGPQ
jgi:hypothetical protein